MNHLFGFQSRLSTTAFCLFLLVVCWPETSFAQRGKKKLSTNGKNFTHTPRQPIEKSSTTCEQEPFRTIDGTCNNTTNPERMEWGAADIALMRTVNIDYGQPDTRNDMAGQNRPSPRKVSNVVVAQAEDLPSNRNLSSLVFTWGQFLDHDIDLSPESETEYEPIALPADEPLFSYDIPFFRSEVHEGTGETNARQQTNIITSWIDASNVYGSEDSRAQWLRTFNHGKLKTSAGNLLPYNTIDGELDSEIDPDAPSMAGDNGGTVKTFVAGDVRAAEQPGLTSLHTLFVREHNRICERMRQQGMNDDEEMYQRARKRVGALIQRITYSEFLPALGIQLSPPSGYRPEVRPDIANSFSTAAYRLGHTMVTEELLLRDNRCDEIGPGSLSLVEAFFNPEVLETYNIDPILKGLSMQVQQEVDPYIIDNLRNFLFAVQGSPGNFGLDLASLNIQRGRDHGLPDYNRMRAIYLGTPATNFNQITGDPQIRQALMEVSNNNINNLDPWVGLLSEQHLPGKSVGPTLHAMLRHQFERLRDGDFYFYQHDPFLPPQVRDRVNQTSLADVIEDNTSLENLPNDIFLAEECRDRPNGGGGGRPGGGRPGGGRPGGGGGGNLTESGSTPLAEGLVIFPNPASETVQIQLKVEEMQTLHLRIMDLQGKVMIEQVANDLYGWYEVQLNLSTWPKGVYQINVRTEEQMITQKLVVQ